MKKTNKILSFILLFVITFTFSINAENNNTVDNATDSEIIKMFLAEVNRAIKDATLPEPCNLPTLLKQPYDRPHEDDIFGINNDTTPIFRVEVDPNDENRKNLIAFSFDSAYINRYTYRILDILDQYDIKATFFMTYEFMSKNPAQVIEIVKRGHEIGNHSTTHPDLNLVSDYQVVYEITRCHSFMKNLTGIDMCLFRFPLGSYSPRTVTLIKSLGYYPIQWTFDSIDWRNEPIEILMRRFVESELLIPGGIILYHNGADYTPDALPQMIEFLYEKGLRIGRVSDVIYHHGFHVKNGHQYIE